MTLKWDGIDNLNKSLAGLSKDFEQKVGRSAAAAGASVIRKQARVYAATRLKVNTGALVKNIVASRRRAPKFKHIFAIGVRHGAEQYKKGKAAKESVQKKRGGFKTIRINDPFYFRFLEVGTKFIRRRNFIGDAIKDRAQDAVNAMSNVLQKRIEKERNK